MSCLSVHNGETDKRPPSAGECSEIPLPLQESSLLSRVSLIRYGTDIVAEFVSAVISVCVLNLEGKLDLNQPWSPAIKTNEQVPICIKAGK